MKVVPLHDWGIRLDRHGLLMIAGPCSAESREQVLGTARGLSGLDLSGFRAGIWKPRTHPGTFEGVGEAGFPWLTEARKATGLKTFVEVANGEHVRQALSHGVDGIWLGARTTVTPFAVQEICDALGGADLPVLVKNPVSPDLELWVGAMERLWGSGVRRLAGIWRGVRVVGCGKYRNSPMWSLPLEFRRRLPGVPCLCDPSHIAGNRLYLAELCQQALNLAFDGLMIESHCSPDSALSDSSQQLTPESLGELFDSLCWVCRESVDVSVREHLSAKRRELEELDRGLLELLSRRMSVSRELGGLKKAARLTVLQASQWDHSLGRKMSLGHVLGLEEGFVRDLFERIHLESIEEQLQDRDGTV